MTPVRLSWPTPHQPQEGGLLPQMASHGKPAAGGHTPASGNGSERPPGHPPGCPSCKVCIGSCFSHLVFAPAEPRPDGPGAGNSFARPGLAAAPSSGSTSLPATGGVSRNDKSGFTPFAAKLMLAMQQLPFLAGEQRNASEGARQRYFF